jgi:hypothetical protein
LPVKSRKSRGIKSQVLVAAYLQGAGWPYATDAGPGRPGKDILGVPFRCEVKARAGFDPVAALRQAVASAGDGPPFAVMRMNGQGPACIEDWVSVIRFGDLVELLRRAGYGDGAAHPGVGTIAPDSP